MKFSKLQATGNDFILIDARNIEKNWAKLAQDICHRHFGVGADGLIVMHNSQVADLKMRIFNPDGSEAEVCGNGLRCIAKYAVENDMVPNHPREGSKMVLTVETLSGIKRAKAFMLKDKVSRVEINMGIPQFQPEQIPIVLTQPFHFEEEGLGKGETRQSPLLEHALVAEGKKLTLSILSLGNPHAVIFLSEPVTDFPLAEMGPKVETHPMFPQRVNFEIARVLNRDELAARVWERGVGETLACGSGACAIAVAARLHGYIGNQVDITLPGGVLSVSWDGIGEVVLAGPVKDVFLGEWLA